jgi:hypothetical protein
MPSRRRARPTAFTSQRRPPPRQPTTTWSTTRASPAPRVSFHLRSSLTTAFSPLAQDLLLPARPGRRVRRRFRQGPLGRQRRREVRGGPARVEGPPEAGRQAGPVDMIVPAVGARNTMYPLLQLYVRHEGLSNRGACVAWAGRKGARRGREDVRSLGVGRGHERVGRSRRCGTAGSGGERGRRSVTCGRQADGERKPREERRERRPRQSGADGSSGQVKRSDPIESAQLRARRSTVLKNAGRTRSVTALSLTPERD